jgi:glycosyltransferase involved in cell wall biosynthesis
MHVLGSARTDGRVMRAATALVEAGYAVSIVDVERDRDRPAEEIVQGVSLKHLKLPLRSASFTPAFILIAVQMFVFGMLRLTQSQADIYHAHDLNALPATFLAACLRHKPVLFDAHEYASEEGESSPFQSRLHRIVVFFLRLLLPRCRGVITVSPQIARGFCDQFSLSAVTVVRNIPVYQAVTRTNRLRETLGLSKETRIALYQGGLQSNRDLDRLVRAAPFLEQNNVIVLMGQDAQNTKARLESLILLEGVTDRVKILPAVPYEDLLEWTSSADLGLIIFPPDYSLSIRWCLPNKLFEYLMAGLPVLSSPLEAVADIILNYDVGKVAFSLVPEDIANAINTILSDQNACERMRFNALKAAREELCWEKEQQHLLLLYHAWKVESNGTTLNNG